MEQKIGQPRSKSLQFQNRKHAIAVAFHSHHSALQIISPDNQRPATGALWWIAKQQGLHQNG